MKKINILLLIIITLLFTGCTSNKEEEIPADVDYLSYSIIYHDIYNGISIKDNEYLGKYYIFVATIDSIDNSIAKMSGINSLKLEVEFKNNDDLKKFNVNDRVEIIGKITEIKKNNDVYTLIIKNSKFKTNLITVYGTINIEGSKTYISDSNYKYDISNVVKKTEINKPNSIVIDDKEYEKDSSIKVKVRAKNSNGVLAVENISEVLEGDGRVYNKEEESNKNVPTMYVFHGSSCPHCHELINWLDTFDYDKEYKVELLEVWSNKDNYNLLLRVSNALKVEFDGVPYVVIGDKVINGFSQSKTPTIIREALDKANNDIKKNKYIDYVKKNK